jgi:hypothetical protein
MNETATAEPSLQTKNFDLALVERTPVRVCERILGATASCVVIPNFATAMAKSLASTIKELSDQGSCDTMRGTYEFMSWVYYFSGRDCDTTAQQATIAGAIKTYYRSEQSPHGTELSG